MKNIFELEGDPINQFFAGEIDFTEIFKHPHWKRYVVTNIIKGSLSLAFLWMYFMFFYLIAD